MCLGASDPTTTHILVYWCMEISPDWHRWDGSWAVETGHCGVLVVCSGKGTLRRTDGQLDAATFILQYCTHCQVYKTSETSESAGCIWISLMWFCFVKPQWLCTRLCTATAACGGLWYVIEYQCCCSGGGSYIWVIMKHMWCFGPHVWMMIPTLGRFYVTTTTVWTTMTTLARSVSTIFLRPNHVVDCNMTRD